MIDKDAEIVRLNRRVDALEGELIEWRRQGPRVACADPGGALIGVAKARFRMTPNEVSILMGLVTSGGRLFSRPALLDLRLNPSVEIPETQLAAVMTSKIRAKLRRRGWDDLIITEWGMGFRVDRRRAAEFLDWLASDD